MASMWDHTDAALGDVAVYITDSAGQRAGAQPALGEGTWGTMSDNATTLWAGTIPGNSGHSLRPALGEILGETNDTLRCGLTRNRFGDIVAWALARETAEREKLKHPSFGLDVAALARSALITLPLEGGIVAITVPNLMMLGQDDLERLGGGRIRIVRAIAQGANGEPELTIEVKPDDGDEAAIRTVAIKALAHLREMSRDAAESSNETLLIGMIGARCESRTNQWWIASVYADHARTPTPARRAQIDATLSESIVQGHEMQWLRDQQWTHNANGIAITGAHRNGTAWIGRTAQAVEPFPALQEVLQRTTAEINDNEGATPTVH